MIIIIPGGEDGVPQVRVHAEGGLDPLLNIIIILIIMILLIIAIKLLLLTIITITIQLVTLLLILLQLIILVITLTLILLLMIMNLNILLLLLLLLIIILTSRRWTRPCPIGVSRMLICDGVSFMICIIISMNSSISSSITKGGGEDTVD